MNHPGIANSLEVSAVGHPNAVDVRRAVSVLRKGGLIGLPTETVYGLGADAGNAAAVARIFTAKGRPADHPLIVHLHRASQLPAWARHVPLAAWELAEAFWPGPLTMILSRTAGALDAVTGGLDTVALRVPAHPLALQVLEQFDGGIAAPSANRHKKISPTTMQDVHDELGDAVDLLLDGGPCSIGIESTIVDLSTDSIRILRPGSITAQDLQRVTRRVIGAESEASVRCPGRMDSHYAPCALVLLAALEQVEQQLAEWRTSGARVGVLAAQRSPAWPSETPWLPLGTTADEQAQQLYHRLREADRIGLDVLIAVPPPDHGLGHALRDRLRRAAGLGDAPA
ncbi:MAG: L-threonylcarbamoyladenylate synthase [Rhodanobacter sp.]